MRLYLKIIILALFITTPLYMGVQNSLALNEPPFNLPSRAEISKLRTAIIDTDQGEIFVELYPEEAPWHVANFKYLADKDFYRGLPFHYLVPNYLLIGGDPLGTGKGGPGYTLPAEFSDRKHELGTLGMGRGPNVVNPERSSNGSQFYIVLGDAHNLDRSYSIFGKVVKGFNVLKRLRKGDRIRGVTVFVR